MRIIAGEFRGRKLLPPEDDSTTRPITDRVKQSLFDILTPLLPDAVVYDLFAGTGSMGLECLSRGAAHASFYEADRSALTRLRQNIAALRVEKSATVIPGDLFRAIATSTPSKPPTLIFLDPPYRFLREQPDRLKELATHLARHAAPEAVLIFRHDAADQLALPPFAPHDTRSYGGMTLELMGRQV